MPSESLAAQARAQEPPAHRPSRASDTGHGYYGRPPIKAAPFNPWAVGGYVFLAGLSGGATVIATLARLGRGTRATEKLVRRGRALSLLAPVLGAPLLVWDLHTPQRFYNMLRVAKGTSPMSIGTWILSAFTGFAGAAFAGQFAADRLGWRWPRAVARAADLPAALAGAGLGTYTAALLSATSTPLWAVAPRALALRFAGSSIASGAAALGLGERSRARRHDLDTIALAGLALELAATALERRAANRAGVLDGPRSAWGRAESLGAGGLGAAAPAATLLACLVTGSEAPQAARLAILAGSALLRVAVIGAGQASAATPGDPLRLTSARRHARSG